MIGQIGAKRTFMIIGLGAVAAALAIAHYFVFQPRTESVEQELNRVMSDKGQLETEIAKMRSDFETFSKQKTYFETISKMGFFNDQDRILARERFDTMQRLSKIISARYEIRAANIIADESAEKTGFVVMESPIQVSLSAIDDLDVYRFIYYLNYGFPGHITINNLDIERKAEITPTILKQIGTGAPPEIVSAKLDLEWRTMARKDSIATQIIAPATDATGAAGGAAQ